ncbi:MAG TPA: glycoside hydrolase domain-containing protein [Candidatus Acidoferrum sp.]|nr:glycoside hydrolase domain-containing protein [Candidatus Acidoferrum sp.]
MLTKLTWKSILVTIVAIALSPLGNAQATGKSQQHAYLGFDANDYPGDAVLPQLRKTFSFAGYWLNHPPYTPSGSLDTWLGHRAALAKQGFGFLVLFNGRLDKELRAAADPRVVGANDARDAATVARHEGFPPGTVIFVDEEEGGSMYDEQMAYLLAWFDGIVAQGFRAGIYCSGMPASEGYGQFTVTANFIRARAAGRKIVYFVFNDACPPSPGCVLADPPPPSASGVDFASVWQFTQSPRRRNYTRRCSATYARDGNCYAPGVGPGSPYIDTETSVSPDPSAAR